MTNPRQHAHDDHDDHDDHDHYLIPFILIFTFAIVEAVGSWYTGSLALLSDAGHMFTDVTAVSYTHLDVYKRQATNTHQQKHHQYHW